MQNKEGSLWSRLLYGAAIWAGLLLFLWLVTAGIESQILIGLGVVAANIAYWRGFNDGIKRLRSDHSQGPPDD